MGLTEDQFWAMSPRKLIALIDADRDIEDAGLSRLAYVLKTGQMPPKHGEEEYDQGDVSALYF